jgi:hypothetical protein
MKKLYTIIIAVLLTASTFAQSPEKISYQAVLRDANDNLLTSTLIGIQISVLQGTATGTFVYVETQTSTTNANGLISIEIGTGVTGDDFSVIDWANGPYFIKTEVDPTGGTTYSITGTSQILSVPFALHAKTAEGISGTITETDPIFSLSIANGITETDTANWNNKLEVEIDSSITNEIQSLTLSNDTIYLDNGGFVKLPDTVLFASYADSIGNINYNDTSAINELQTLYISSDTIFLSQSNYAILPDTSIYSRKSDTSEVAKSLLITGDNGNQYILKIDSSGNLYSEQYYPDTTTTNIIISFEVSNASRWFGGDNRSIFEPRNISAGQSISFQQNFEPDSFSVKFSHTFDYSENSENTGHDVDLKLIIRNLDGSIINSIIKHVESTFTGGWVTFDLTSLNILLEENSEYVFTWYLIDGYNNGLMSGASADADAGFLYGSGYIGGVYNATDDIEDWNNWARWNSEEAWDFNFRLYGKE